MSKAKEEQIELRQLRYFITLAEELHFARAAERLKMEQSPLSRAIRNMERMLGVRLFERSTRSTRITRAGSVLLEYARQATALVEQASTSAKSAALGQTHQLRIGVADCTAYCQVLEVLAQFKTQNPDVSVLLHEMPLYRQICWVRDDLLDASISLDGSNRDGISAQALSRDAISALVPVTHPLAKAEAISAADLVLYPLVLFSAESDLGASTEFDCFMETLGRFHVAFRASSLGTMLALVALGHGVGLVGSAQMTAVKRRDVLLRPIVGSASIGTYALHSNCGVSKPLGAFIDLARDRFATF